MKAGPSAWPSQRPLDLSIPRRTSRPEAGVFTALGRHPARSSSRIRGSTRPDLPCLECQPALWLALSRSLPLDFARSLARSRALSQWRDSYTAHSHSEGRYSQAVILHGALPEVGVPLPKPETRSPKPET